MNPIKKTIVKYFISDDGTISFGAIGLSCGAVLATVTAAMKLWPLSPDEITTVAGIFGAGIAAVGGYRKIGKK
jgi:phosphate/sulfate permease